MAIRQQIANAVDLIVQVERFSDGTRRTRSLTEVTTMEGDQVMLQDLFVFEKRGLSPEGRVVGRFAATGIRPRFYEKILATGISIGAEVFEDVLEVGE
jgi:pilus assembly protein CpaF